MIKIAIIGSHGYPFVYGGYETFVKELSERLVKNEIEVTIYCRRNYFDERPTEINGIHLIYIPTIKRKTLAQFVHSFLSIIHATFKNFNILLVVNPANGPFGIIPRIFGKKTVINVDGLEWLRPKWKGLGAKYFYFSAKLCTKFYNVIVNDSKEMQRVYKELFKVDSILIEYGANIRYSQNDVSIKKFGLDVNDYYLLVGRFIPDNNWHIIINEFIKTRSSKKLVVVGNVPYKDQYVSDLKNIKDPRLVFTGYVTDQNDLAELYNNCYAYIHGHEFGGTNPALLTALANGAAPLALETPFNKEMLEDGKYGIFFSKKEGNLSSIINEIENDPSLINRIKLITRNRISEYYNWDRITTEYISLFNNILKN